MMHRRRSKKETFKYDKVNLVKVIEKLVGTVGDFDTRIECFETKENINNLREQGGKGKTKHVSVTNSNKEPEQQDDEKTSKAPREQEGKVKPKNDDVTNSNKEPKQEDNNRMN